MRIHIESPGVFKIQPKTQKFRNTLNSFLHSFGPQAKKTLGGRRRMNGDILCSKRFTGMHVPKTVIHPLFVAHPETYFRSKMTDFQD